MNTNAQQYQPGITMKSLVLSSESATAAQALLERYIVEHKPSTPVEFEIVEMLAIFQWQLLRALNMQTGYLENAAVRQAEAIEKEFHSAGPASRAAEAFRNLATQDNSFQLLIRYTAEIRRAYASKLRELDSLRQRREQAQPDTKKPEVRNEPKRALELVPETPRNAQCPCKSGQKFKRCCGRGAPPVLDRAA